MRRYLALGDSYTLGEAVTRAEGWPMQLAAGLRAAGRPCAEPLLLARTGWTTAELSAALAAAPPRGPFDLVTVQIGVNDQYRGGTAQLYQPVFAALLERALALAGGRPGRVLVLSIPDWGVTPFAQGLDRAAIAAHIDAFNAVNRAEAARCGASYLDITPLSRRAMAEPALIAADGLHASGALYAAWAALARPIVLSMLAE